VVTENVIFLETENFELLVPLLIDSPYLGRVQSTLLASPPVFLLQRKFHSYGFRIIKMPSYAQRDQAIVRRPTVKAWSNLEYEAQQLYQSADCISGNAQSERILQGPCNIATEGMS
jgi:hypothetical protein